MAATPHRMPPRRAGPQYLRHNRKARPERNRLRRTRLSSDSPFALAERSARARKAPPQEEAQHGGSYLLAVPLQLAEAQEGHAEGYKGPEAGDGDNPRIRRPHTELLGLAGMGAVNHVTEGLAGCTRTLTAACSLVRDGRKEGEAGDFRFGGRAEQFSSRCVLIPGFYDGLQGRGTRMRGVWKIVPANARSPKILRKELLRAQAREQASEAESYLISVQLRCGERNRQRERRAKEAAEM